MIHGMSDEKQEPEPRSRRRGTPKPPDADAEAKPGADTPAEPGAPPEEPRARTPVTQQIGRVVVLALVVLFVIFAVGNAQPVDFSWIFGETRVTEDAVGETSGGVPLILLLLASFAIGAAAGSGLAWQRARQRQRDGNAG